MGYYVSRSGIIIDILLIIAVILTSVYVGIFRGVLRREVVFLLGPNFYYLSWVTGGGYCFLTSLLLMTSFLDGDSTRRSWMAILSSLVGGALYFTLAVISSLHMRDLDRTNALAMFSDYEVRGYKCLLAVDYTLAFVFWIDCGLRALLRLRSGSGKH